MQDTRSICDGGGRFFAGGSGGGDRRLRPHHNQNHHQSLKCPRCDSLNTKFCYYNNYNVSQPRHFCKNCRRYWTKGGVLRNVPVGGGCRKTRRSKHKQTVSTESAAAAVPAPAPDEQNSNSHSSSESSSLTATTTAAKKTPVFGGSTGEIASATENSSNWGSNLMNFTDARFFLQQMNPDSSFDHPQPLIDPAVTSEGQIFTEMGTFTSLMTSSNDQSMLGFTGMTATDISAYELQHDHQGSVIDDQSSNQMVGNGSGGGGDELKMEQMDCGFLDQMAEIELSGLQQNRISNGGLPRLHWQINGLGDGGDGGREQGLFDFTGTVDQAYWHQNQWSDNDPALNFPPLV
ncbi:hypothetical protein ACH5RR_008706 [Cinchona calisaya]|uniref:Dof zinc finger protein n=1 Tax=Cinchona calisaya TaxID=153742 RepID=A0ABD3ADW0_9GENT